MLIMLNGSLVEEQQAVVSVFDHGYMYGFGLFETFRVYAGKPFLLGRHHQRLIAACEQIGIHYKLKESELRARVDQVLRANQWNDAYVRWTVTAGDAPLGLPTSNYSKPTEVIYMKPLPPSQPFSLRPTKALQQLKLKRNTPEGTIRYKSLHYMNNILGKRECATYPWIDDAEGLFLDEHGHLTEGIVSTLFFVKDHVLYTPTIATGILPGITRAYVLELATKAGMKKEEGYYTWQQLCAADEIFLTNSIQELVAVDRLFDVSGKQWEFSGDYITSKLADLYEQDVRGD